MNSARLAGINAMYIPEMAIPIPAAIGSEGIESTYEELAVCIGFGGSCFNVTVICIE